MELAELNKYIGGKKRHYGYLKACYLYEQMRVPAEGEFPAWDTALRRSVESVNTQEFRRFLWVEISKETISQVLTCISKIRRSSDWSVEFPKENPSFIPEKETLRSYTEKYFPFYTTFESYVFSVLLKNYLIDANAVVLVKPLKTELAANEYSQPYPFIFNTPQVLDYKEGEYVVLEIIIHKTEDGQNVGTEERKYITVDKESIQTWIRSGDGFKVEEDYKHGLGVMPCFRMRGRFFKNYNQHTVQESPIQTVGARLKEFDREYGDLQAAVYQHMFPEKWQWATQLCLTCNVSGVSTGSIWVDEKGNRTSKATKKQVVCPQCHGQGQVAASPYQNIVVRPSKKNAGESEITMPPAGYIAKPTEIITIQTERCNNHAYMALCSVNMQFLMQVRQNQSGYAKDVDREELNNFAYGCAEDIVWMMDKCHYFFAKYRYRAKSDGQSLSDDEIVKLLPKIAVPQKFDLLSSNYLIDELEKATRANLNPLILAQLNLEYGVKHFYAEPEMRDKLKLVMQLDPLPGLSEEDKMLRLQNFGISEEDYILSCNIYQFVIRAISENPQFQAMKPKEQIKILKGYTQELQGEIEDRKEEKQEAQVKVEERINLNGN